MIPSAITETIPIEADAHGVVRVGGTRITLDTVIAAFSNGATTEEIVQQYPTLQLADVYHVIGYYLRRQSEVEEYWNNEKSRWTPSESRTRHALTLKAFVSVY
jgi:uncharacterized protein (DUF433 family)